MTITPFDKLSEAAGIPIADEAASMMATRYLTASEYARGRRTLELACASGPGLGLLNESAALTIGADINAAMIDRAHRHYRGRVPVAQLSVEALPFRAASFDFVLLLEASYYVQHFEHALSEMERVLAPGGQLMFVNANPERDDFIRSPFSHTYHSADQFRSLLETRGFHVETFGAFPVDDTDGGRTTIQSRVTSLARRALESLHLVPNTLAGRAKLKRLLGQKLRDVPPEIDAGFAKRAPLATLAPGPVKDFKVIYVNAHRRL
jgi:SAM-dependent methyltransferase